jgi:bacterioferritin-associated ferredoxin
MYVCVCKAVSDRKIRQAVDGGVCTLKGLKDRLGVGSVCGRCVPEARAVIEQTRNARIVAGHSEAGAALATAA